jgi:phosphatidylethanolamine-binding protein (PEBP) family uncharacterized protein
MDLGPNISPELRWTGVPERTAQLLLVIEDIDAPRSRPSLHTVALLPPDMTGLAEGELTRDNPAIRYLPATRGRLGYLGPRPLPGHGIHRYGFHLYALDEAVPADRELTGMPDILAAAQGHVLAGGCLEGIRKGRRAGPGHTPACRRGQIPKTAARSCLRSCRDEAHRASAVAVTVRAKPRLKRSPKGRGERSEPARRAAATSAHAASCSLSSLGLPSRRVGFNASCFWVCLVGLPAFAW